MKHKRLLVVFVISMGLFSNFGLCYGAEDDLHVPILSVNRVEANARLGELVTQIEI